MHGERVDMWPFARLLSRLKGFNICRIENPFSLLPCLGPECYQPMDACNPSPCQNGGKCSKAGPHLQQFLCECVNHWYGPTCTKLYSACNSTREALLSTMNLGSDVCLNGGRCIDHPSLFKYSCECGSGWKGARCETPDVRILPDSFNTKLFNLEKLQAHVK